MIKYEQLEQLEMEYGSPLYIFDVNKLTENYYKMERAFKSRYENFIIGYSYKTNYLPYLCKKINNLGGYAEVVSRLEYDLALKIGINPQKIIFNGPIKTYEDLELALLNKSIVNINSFYEVEHLERICLLHKNNDFSIGIRVNFDISVNGESPLQDGYQVSRFGICYENGDFERLLKKVSCIKNLKVIGLHGHFSTKTRSVTSYQKITKGLCNIAKEHLIDHLEFIDIGGGIFGEVPKSFQIDTPTFDEYASEVCKIMNDEFYEYDKKPFLILEPGISMVANTFTFIAKVIDIKNIRNQNFVVVNGSVHNIKPTMHKRNLPFQIVEQRNKETDQNEFHIVGYTCMEKDYLAYALIGKIPNRHDYILFENVGAYTIVFNPPFIQGRPSIIALEQNNTFIVRNQETIDLFFNEHFYAF